MEGNAPTQRMKYMQNARKKQGRVSCSRRAQRQLHSGGNLSLRKWVGASCVGKLAEHWSEGAVRSTCVFGGISSNLGRLRCGMGGS